MTKKLEFDETDIEEGEFVDVGGEDISNLQNDVDSQMQSIFAEFGGDEHDDEFKIVVYRMVPNRAEREYCFACFPADLPIMEKIRSEYGSGRYEIWIRKNGKIFKRTALSIAETKKKIEPLTPVVSSNDSQLHGVINQLVDKVTAMQQQPSQGGDMFGAMMTNMVQMQQMFSAMQPKQDNQIDTLLQGIKLAGGLGSHDGGGDKEDSIYSLLSSVVNTFGEPIARAATQAQLNQPAGSQHIPGQPIPGQPIDPNATGNTAMNMMKIKLNFLLTQAKRNADPFVYADLILDQLTPEQVTGFINSPEAMSNMIKILPEITNHQPWFISLQTAINELLKEDTETPDGEIDANIPTKNKDTNDTTGNTER